ncbi:MAG: YkvA family protein [Anaerolineaceae bacterium]|jgi:uncharacterized membrane protein YkvA (DUF1232 family)
MNIKERAKQLKSDLPVVFLALKKKETPLAAKLLAGITVAYALSPVDLIPDFVPVLGYLDDVIILPLLVALTVKSIPKNIFDQCQVEAQGLWADGKPKKWYYAIPFVLVWGLILFFVIRAIINR